MIPNDLYLVETLIKNLDHGLMTEMCGSFSEIHHKAEGLYQIENISYQGVIIINEP